DEHRESMAAWVALQLLRGTSVRNSMSELASHALLLEVIIGGRARLREALIAAGEPIDDHTVNQEWVRLFEDPLRAKARAEHHMQYLADPELVKLIETSGGWITLMGLLDLDGGAGLVDPYLGWQGWG